MIRMHRSIPRVALAALLVPALAGGARAQDVAVRGAVIHTMAGEPIRDGVILVQGGKIAAIGPAAEVWIPASVRTLEAAVVTPGLIDAHSVVGLAGWLNYRHDSDQLERSAPIQPELRALDAYDAREPLIAWVRSFGVTTLHTGHAPGAVVSGQTMIVKTHGQTVDQALVRPRAMVAATLGQPALREGEVPGTRAKAVALLRAELVHAQEYAAKRAAASEDEPVDRDLRLEVLADVLAGDLPLLVTAQRANDILTTLRVAKEFGITVVLDGAAEAYLVLDELRAAGVPVIVHPTMTRPNGETANVSFETAALLVNAGVRVALQAGYESYVPKTRVVLFEAGIAAANGLSFEQALATITIDAARILGIDDRVGSLEVGKDADIALYDGDPFETVQHCVGVVIDGQVVADTAR